MLLNFTLASQLHQAKVTVNLLKIYYLIQEQTKTSKKGKWSNSFVFCAGLCLQTEAETF
jgi:hypothetical protein